MEKKQMRLLWCIQILFLVLFAAAIVSLCLPRWKIDDQSLNILYQDETGAQNRAVPAYQQMPLLPFSEDETVGDAAINRRNLNHLLANISNDYIHTYDFTKTQISLTVLSKSNHTFCYRISGAENGDYWDIWVLLDAQGAANATVYKSEGTV